MPIEQHDLRTVDWAGANTALNKIRAEVTPWAGDFARLSVDKKVAIGKKVIGIRKLWQLHKDLGKLFSGTENEDI